jgi:hypothetical protein
MNIKISRENMCTEYLSLSAGDIDTVDAGREGQKVSRVAVANLERGLQKLCADSNLQNSSESIPNRIL